MVDERGSPGSSKEESLCSGRLAACGLGFSFLFANRG